MALYNMKEILADAQKRGYGVGFFNAVNLEMIRAYIEAAEELDSPIIIGTAEALLPIAPFEWIVPAMLEAARRAKAPVAVHLDHTYHFKTLMQALRAGFGSIMYDGSRESHEDNLKHSAAIARIAHGMGVGLECELGSVSGLTDETGHEDEMVYTDPAEAAEFLERTGADFPGRVHRHAARRVQGRAASGHPPPPRDTRRGGRAAGAARRFRALGRRFPQHHLRRHRQDQRLYGHHTRRQARALRAPRRLLHRRPLPGAGGHEGSDGEKLRVFGSAGKA